MGMNAVYMALATCSAVGLLLVGLAIPLALEKVARNRWYGFRTPKTLSSDAIWYPANRAAAINFICAGIFILLAAAVLFVAKNSMTAQTVALAIAIITALAIIGAVVKSFMFLSRRAPNV